MSTPLQKKRDSSTRTPEAASKKAGKIDKEKISKAVEYMMNQLDNPSPDGVDSLTFVKGPDGSVYVSTDNGETFNPDSSSAFATPPKPCAGCKSSPCLVQEFGADLLTEATCYRAIHGHRLENRKIRYYLYRDATRRIHGHLGKGIRLVLPKCLEKFIRANFPNEDDTDYIGFKEYEDAIESEETDHSELEADY